MSSAGTDWNRTVLGRRLRSFGLDSPRSQVAAVIHVENVSWSKRVFEDNRERHLTVVAVEADNDVEEEGAWEKDARARPCAPAPSDFYIFWTSLLGTFPGKRAANLTGSEYLFGRHDIADIVLARRCSRAKISSFHFALRVQHNLWTVEHLARSWTSVNRSPLSQRGATVTLHPTERNTLKLPGNTTIHIYCGDPSHLDFYFKLVPPIEQLLKSTSNLETCARTFPRSRQPHSVKPEATLSRANTGSHLYFLPEDPINGRDCTRTCRACQYRVVKIYQFKNLPCLKRRLDIVRASPDHDSVIIYCDLIHIRKHPTHITPWEETLPLSLCNKDMSLRYQTDPYASFHNARTLLWSLLRIVGHINMHGVAHRDICLHTVLVRHPDPEGVNILLGDFSEHNSISDEDYTQVLSRDCFDVFKTVQSFLQSAGIHNSRRTTKTLGKQGWIGHPHLDRLWAEVDSQKPWTTSVLDVCKETDLQSHCRKQAGRSSGGPALFSYEDALLSSRALPEIGRFKQVALPERSESDNLPMSVWVFVAGLATVAT